MAVEREIKLALPAASAKAAMRFLTTCTASAGQVMRLDNIYFDTPDLALSQSKSALRLRRTPAGWLQTFKTLGTAQDGLHVRHEWEMPVAGEELDLERLPDECDAMGIAHVLRNAAPALIALFRTNFTRTSWLLHSEHASIEIAIDQGEIVADVNGDIRRAPISEIELELKRGDAAALHIFAAQLAAHIPGLTPDDVSKAQRGYELRAWRGAASNGSCA
jgi:inorganic triphosphatase YgiF